MRVIHGCRWRRCVTFIVVAVTLTLSIWLLIPYQRPPLNLEPANWEEDQEPGWVTLEARVEPPQGGIMLLEGQGGDRLTLRMFCTVESAALTHPHLPVTVLMTSMVIKDTPILHNLTQSYPNMRFLHLNATQLFHESPLEAWHMQRKWENSYWPLSHYNDALRWLLLWQYGGIYLDMDVVVLRPLTQLPNCTGLESERWVAAGVLKFDPRRHPVMEACVRELAENYDGSVWGANGPELLTRVLQKRCKLELPSGRTAGCPDVKVMPQRAFYPIPWWDWRRYLAPDLDLTHDLLGDPGVLVLHVWNQHTAPYPVFFINQEPLHRPYAAAALARCPITVQYSGGVM